MCKNKYGFCLELNFALVAHCKLAQRVQVRKEHGNLPSADVTLHSPIAKSIV